MDDDYLFSGALSSSALKLGGESGRISDAKVFEFAASCYDMMLVHFLGFRKRRQAYSRSGVLVYVDSPRGNVVSWPANKAEGAQHLLELPRSRRSVSW